MGIITHFGITAITQVVLWILYMFGSLAGLFVTLMGQLVNWSLTLNSYIIGSNVVTTGWTITRDIANLGFVLIIIIIALATIVGYESYGMKKNIWRLIAAALLVNFSLVIAGLFINAGGMFTNFFLEKASSNYDIGTQLVSKMQVQKLLEIKDASSIEKDIKNGIEDVNTALVLLSSQFFVLILTIIIGLALFGVASMFFYRYISLTILLIIAPLAWLAWTWPDSSGQFKKWWSSFFNWILFGPIAAFSIYLAVAIANNGGFASTNSLGATTVIDNGFIGSISSMVGILIANLGGTLAQMIAVVSVLVGGMAMANSMAGNGADLAMKGVGKVKGWVTGAVGGTAATTGRWVARKAGEAGAGEGKPSLAQRAATGFAKIPLIGGIAGRQLNKLGQQPKKQREEWEKEVKDLPPEMLQNFLKSPTVMMNDARAAALVNVSAGKTMTDPADGKKKSILETFSKEEQTKFFDLAKRTGTGGDILKIRPDFAVQLGKTIKDATDKLKVKDWENISDEALENTEVIRHLDMNIIEKIIKEGSQAQKTSMIKGLTELRSKIGEIADKAEMATAQKTFDSKAEFFNNNISIKPFLPEKGFELFSKEKNRNEEKKESTQPSPTILDAQGRPINK